METSILKAFQNLEPASLNRILEQITDGCAVVNKDLTYIYWNKALEELTGFKKEEMLEKNCTAEPGLFTDPTGKNLCAENCLCAQALKDGKPLILDVYIQNKNGYRIPVTLKALPLKALPLINSEGQAVGVIKIIINSTPAITIPLKINELERMQLLDIDTGIPGRTYMELYLKNKIEEYQKYGIPFGIIYADVDNFAKIQERFGRFNAVKLVRMMARTIYKNIRYFDIVARWDTEEFLIGLLNIDENRLDIVANKLRLLVAESYITVETGLLNATVSMGATLVQRFDTVESLVKRAEQLMLHSKWRGRNKVSLTFTQRET